MTETNPEVLSHHIWWVPQHCLHRAATQAFNNTPRRDGFRVWRDLVLEINSQTGCRRFSLRDRFQSPSQAAGNNRVDQALDDWETLCSEHKGATRHRDRLRGAQNATPQDLAGHHQEGLVPQDLRPQQRGGNRGMDPRADRVGSSVGQRSSRPRTFRMNMSGQRALRRDALQTRR